MRCLLCRRPIQSTRLHLSADPFSFDSSMAKIRAEFMMGLHAPTRVPEPRARHHERMEEHWIEMAHRCGRPAYHEAPGFTRSRYGTAGHEKPYGYGSRTFWHYVWLAMKSAFWAGYHEHRGTEGFRVEGNAPQAIIRNITS